jgi:hypothetical protein
MIQHSPFDYFRKSFPISTLSPCGWCVVSTKTADCNINWLNATQSQYATCTCIIRPRAKISSITILHILSYPLIKPISFHSQFYFTRSTFRSASSILFLLELLTVLTISCGNLIYPTIQAAFILLDQHMEFPYQTSESGQLAIFYHFQISIRNSSIRESSLSQISFDPFHSKSHPHILYADYPWDRSANWHGKSGHLSCLAFASIYHPCGRNRFISQSHAYYLSPFHLN